MKIVVGVDASRNRSGGAIAHLVGILRAGDPPALGIGEVHLWSYKKLLDAVPDAPWLVKHNPPELQRSLLAQAWWQYHSLHREARKAGCNILLSTDAGTVGAFKPSVVMSGDMLSYEPGEMERYGLTAGRLRLVLLRFIQTRSLKRADGAIFLTRYAAEVIQGATGQLQRVSIIPHGVGAEFRSTQDGNERPWPEGPDGRVRCLYVSNIAPYKHQWVVVRAIGELRRRGHNLSLLLAGGKGRAQARLEAEIARTDPHREFVEYLDFVPHHELPSLLARAHLFVFASSCENMPITLVEAMASGLPIACSSRGPMPEVLRDGGVYFDPESYSSVAGAIEKLLENAELRASVARRARQVSCEYSWARCASDTWGFLRANVSETCADPIA